MMLRKKIIYPIILVAAFTGVFALGVWVGVAKIAYYVPQPGTIDFSLFWDAYQKLQQNFIDSSKINNQKIIYGAIEGMAKSLGDSYTGFFDPSQAQRFQQDLSGSFEGIGVEIGVKKDTLTVVAPLPGTPGQKAGLKSGDIIVKINDQGAINMTTEEAVNLIRGPKGTSVTLTILRDGWNSAKDIKIIREMIIIPSMKWSLIDSDTAFIQIFQFNETLSADFKTAALKILQTPTKKIVLDLRDNPGGYLEVAQDIAGWFLEKNKVVVAEHFGKGQDKESPNCENLVELYDCYYYSKGPSSFANYPIVVLINQGSASASEILAGALRDNRNIKLIGEKSFGKGSVQEVIDLRGGSFLKITIAKWFTPKGNSISEVGLTPDVKISVTDQDIEQKKDPQLDKALEIIKTIK